MTHACVFVSVFVLRPLSGYRQENRERHTAGWAPIGSNGAWERMENHYDDEQESHIIPGS